MLEEWSCPKCRGICNCSCCRSVLCFLLIWASIPCRFSQYLLFFFQRKKQGQQPTGILSHRAKAIGYSSVSALLHANGLNENMKHAGASPKKQTASDKVRQRKFYNGKKVIMYINISILLNIYCKNIYAVCNLDRRLLHHEMKERKIYSMEG